MMFCVRTNDDLRVSAHQGNRCCRSHENSSSEFYEASRFEGENVHQFNYNVRRRKPPHEDNETSEVGEFGEVRE